jgi:hypothetical protein
VREEKEKKNEKEKAAWLRCVTWPLASRERARVRGSGLAGPAGRSFSFILFYFLICILHFLVSVWVSNFRETKHEGSVKISVQYVDNMEHYFSPNKHMVYIFCALSLIDY